MAAVLLVPPSANAGGWWSWIRLDRANVAIGEKVTVHADVMFRSVEAAEAARSGRDKDAFYVYLLSEFDYSLTARAMEKVSPKNWWSVGSAQAYGLGASRSRMAISTSRGPLLPSVWRRRCRRGSTP